MDLGLTGRVALVTGASGGIGAVVAHTLAAEGARVALGYHDAKDTAERVAAAIRDDGGEAMTVAHDLGDPASSRAVVDAVVAAWGRVDVLVASAWAAPGWASPDRQPESVPVEEWRQQLRVNVEGTAFTVQAVLAPMRAAGFGRIVLLSSGAANGASGMETYAAAKAALRGLCRSLATGVAPTGILVNVVMPGLVPTPRHRETIPAAVLESMAAQTPTRRLASEDDVARVVAFLASAANASVTGADIHVSGGMHM
jgi:NAD(P)-dependent dehydrogenase (short-subunit alcohol dehydrogenase family)